MTEIYQSGSRINVLGNSANETNKIDQQKCINCYFNKKKPKLFFSGCQHNGICIKCAEAHMLSCINDKKFPTCMIDSECKAEMITGQKSLFQYFSQSSLEKWKSFLKNRQRVSNLPPCKVTNCKGVIDKHRCLRCTQQYCENCQQFTHSFLIKCEKKRQIQIDGIKECPRCRQKYERMSGCQHIKCYTCHYQFCEACKKQWSPIHHGCMGSLFQERPSSMRMEKKSQIGGCCALI